MKKIYILLTRTKTVIARLIHGVTGDMYTHASIALDGELNELYSFARRNLYLPLISGFIREDIYSGVFARNPDAPCALYEYKVSDEEYAALKTHIKDMADHFGMYKYNIVGLAAGIFGIPCERKHHFTCSQFVAHILKEHCSVKFNKNINLVKPADFSDIPEFNEIYSGKLKYVKLYNKFSG